MPLPEIKKDDWFSDRPHNPLDDMPIATNDRFDMYGSSDADDAYNPKPEEDARAYASRHQSTPDFEKDAEAIVTMHEKAYRLARSKYNPFSVGGSENIHDFDRKD